MNVHILEMPLDFGASRHGSDMGPSAIRLAGIKERLESLGGSMILESLYTIPGIGRLFIDCINLKDYNVLMTDMAVFTMISLAAGVLLDISYGFIDPRIRMGAKK